MTNDAFICLSGIFTTIWRLFTSWYIPGTNGVTPAMAFMFVLSAGLGLRFVLRILGTNPDVQGGLKSAYSASDNIAERKGAPRL